MVLLESAKLDIYFFNLFIWLHQVLFAACGIFF